MSWDKCQDCGGLVNSDNDPACYVEVGNMRRMTWTECVCELCRVEREQKREAEDDAAGRAESEAEQASQS
jgi:hypothetical protein